MTAQPVPDAVAPLDDHALMARVASRDAIAFRTLVDRHSARPYRIAWRMLGDASEAEDIAQEALLRLWDFGARWQYQSGGVSAWLARVATNLCLDRLRRRKFASDEAVPEQEDFTPLADAQMDEETMRKLTMNAIQSLADRQRAAIILTYYEELSNADAAQMLEMNIKAFESLLLRARQSLRAAFATAGFTSIGELV